MDVEKRLLCSPLKVGHVTLKNRMIKAPQGSDLFNTDQTVSQDEMDFCESIAAGGTSLICLACCQVIPLPDGEAQPSLCDDKFIPGLKKLTDMVHKHDSRIVAQLIHDGASAIVNPFCSSGVTKENLPYPEEYYCFPCPEVTLEQIDDMKKRFVDAAVRAKTAGFDGVEVHTANAYFLLSFLSRVWNHRTDQYGCQSMENRTRLQREIIREIRSKCGDDFIVGVRMNGQEFGHPDAMTIEEGVEAAKWFDSEQVDYISVTGYGYGLVPFQYVADFWAYPEPDEDMKRYGDLFTTGLIVPSARAIKQAVKAPVFVGSRLDEKLGEDILRRGDADGILFGRPLWADPELPNKVMENRDEDIVHCTHCGTCEDRRTINRLHCRVNPSLARERELAIKPAEKRKKILVVGGGPAGMEFARIADMRGHDVVLCESHTYLGGKLPLAVMVKGSTFEDIESIISFETAQIEKSNVKVRLKTEVTRSIIEEEKPDAIVLAIGGSYRDTDSIPGGASKNVMGVPDLAKLAEKPLRIFGANALNKLSKLVMPVGKNIVILGAQTEGLQGALFMKARGKNVTIIDELDIVGDEMPPRYLDRTLHYIKKNDIPIETGVTIDRIDKHGVCFITRDGRKRYIDADTVMVFMSQIPNTSLAKEVEGAADETYVIGGANGAQSSLIVDAFREARELAVRI